MSEKLKKSRALRLTSEIDDRLQAVCDHLGTNPNAYLVLAIGRAIAQDEIAMQAKKNNADLYGQLGSLFAGLVTETDEG